MNFQRLKITTLLLGIICIICSLSAVETPRRPKIGLVLGGGGARGFAHIGVIEWLEKNHIPVDFVVGTSMGGLIGGGFATGLNADKIKEMVDAFDFSRILRVDLPYKALSFRRKEDRRKYLLKLDIGLKHGLRFPAGLISDYNLALAIDRFTFAYSKLKSFDELPIPFRCVAVDLETGEQEILKDGDLSSALRATMAVPGFFSPTLRNNQILADGGVVNNLPVDVAKEMGAEVIIAVDVTGNLGSRASLNSIPGIVNQSLAIMVLNNMKKNLKNADILLAPPLYKISPEDFSIGSKASEEGYIAAETKASLLKKYALSPEEWQKYVDQRDARKQPILKKPDFIEVTTNDQPTRIALEKELAPFVEGKKPFTIKNLEEELSYEAGGGRYDCINYGLCRKDGETGLLITPKRKSYGPPFLCLGLPLYATTRGDLLIDVISRITALDWGTKGSETRIDLSVGSNMTLGAEHLLPLTVDRKLFLAGTAYVDQSQNNFTPNVADDPGLLARYALSTYSLGADIVFNPSRNSELRAGYNAKIVHSPLIAKRLFPNLCDGFIDYLKATYTMDCLDSGALPSKGIRLHLDGKLYLDAPCLITHRLNGLPLRVFGELLYASPVTKSGRIITHLGGGSIGHQKLPLTEQFALGGLARLTSIRTDAIRGQSYLYGTIGYLHHIGGFNLLFDSSIYWGAWYEIGGVGEQFSLIRYRQDLATGLVIESLLGPIFFGASIDEEYKIGLQFGIGVHL